MAALGHDQLLVPVTFSGTLNTERFIGWLTQLKTHLTENQVLFLDNPKVHHARALKEWLEENPMRLVFLPPYSPHFNPIEGLGALLKASLRKMRIRGFDELNDQLPWLLREIAQQYGNALCRMCGYTTTSAL
ncbi:MAG: transposase [Deltaproteobacteria bacterium]|nr:transposase [Deltaproteobacteria bacterium]